MAKEEAEEKVAKTIFEKEEARKALKEEKTDRKTAKETIRVEANEEDVDQILKYRMSYRRSTLFMIKKYPDLDLSDIDLTQMKGYNIFDPADGSELIRDLNVGELPKLLLVKLLKGKSEWRVLRI